MIAPSVIAVARPPVTPVHEGVFVRSPLTAEQPVHSCQVAVLSVVRAPLVRTHVASGTFAVVPATMQIKHRSEFTAGAVNWRTSWPAVTAAFWGLFATA